MDTALYIVSNSVDDTICAISTPAGQGGIAVIRISGPEAGAIVGRCWQGKDISTMATHTVHLGQVIDPQGQLLDQVVLTLFRAPNSYTGQDVIELSCHGSTYIQQQIIATLLHCGCRQAQPGEFTQRAFTNGRMDLSQAEAVADLIASQSQAALRVALNQMRGTYSLKLNQLRERLLHFVSLLELELDFSEEDVSFANREQLDAEAANISEYIGQLAASFRAGNAIKHGFPVAIVGQTNAGKSTLLNALVGDERAIVSPIQGTTRDVIEDTITLGGTLFRLIDTAGIRHSSDTIENMGIERSFSKLRAARIVLWVIDATSGESEILSLAERILSETNADQMVVALLNKADIAAEGDLQHLRTILCDRVDNCLTISAHNSADVDRMLNLLQTLAEQATGGETDLIVTNERHHQALIHAHEALERARAGLNHGVPTDLVSQDIRQCLFHLGEITGQITTDDILGEIFSHFCIGK